ncbi:hypothetical protein FACS1894161_5510 [Spirochaetia bacterium]|nr:hypothetical protein FACS1894161_5510 [Spirochaetia bacterium]
MISLYHFKGQNTSCFIDFSFKPDSSDPEYDGEIPPFLDITEYDSFMNIKYSWYFTYTAVSAQNYVRTLTQGVTLTDSRKLAVSYKRTAMQTVKGTTALSRFATFHRQCLMTVYSSAVLNGIPTLLRFIVEHVRSTAGLFDRRGLTRECAESVKANALTKRSQGFYRKAQEGVRGGDTFSFPVLFLRSMPETVRITDCKKHWAAFFRGLRVEAASRAEASYSGEYCRLQADTVQVQSSVFRGLLIFVKLLTTSFVRDYLLRRFLKSNEELAVKSFVTRELILESKV